jgi:BolA family transcriptional regulator, general stress-responsive regulator
MSVEAEMRRRLMVALEPVRLDVVNESHLHAGHRNSPGTGESHFRLHIVSKRFEGLSRVARHRLVNETLEGLVGGRVHALAMTTTTQSEQDRSP